VHPREETLLDQRPRRGPGKPGLFFWAFDLCAPRKYIRPVEIIALRTWDSRDYGLVRTGLKLTVAEQYGREAIRKGLAKLHVPTDMEQAPRNIAHDRAPREADRPGPPGAGPARPGRAAGSARSSSGRRRAVDGRDSRSRRLRAQPHEGGSGVLPGQGPGDRHQRQL